MSDLPGLFHAKANAILEAGAQAFQLGMCDGFRHVLKGSQTFFNDATQQWAEETNALLLSEEDVYRTALRHLEKHAETLQKEVGSLRAERTRVVDMAERDVGSKKSAVDKLQAEERAIREVEESYLNWNQALQSSLELTASRKKERDRLLAADAADVRSREESLAELYKQLGVAMDEDQRSERLLEANRRERIRRREMLEAACSESDALDTEIADAEHELHVKQGKRRRLTSASTKYESGRTMHAQLCETNRVLEQKIYVLREKIAGLESQRSRSTVPIPTATTRTVAQVAEVKIGDLSAVFEEGHKTHEGELEDDGETHPTNALTKGMTMPFFPGGEDDAVLGELSLVLDAPPPPAHSRSRRRKAVD